MPDPATECVAAFFHASRAAAKKARQRERECPVVQAVLLRVMLAKLEHAAALDAYEVGLE